MFDTIRQLITHHCDCMRQRMQPKIYIKLKETIWKITINGQWLPIDEAETIDVKIPFIDEYTHFNDIISLHFNESEILTNLG